MKFIRRLLLVLLLLLLALAVLLRFRYGGGKYFPDHSTAPLIASEQLETVAQYPEPIGNLAVNRDGRLFFTIHPESRPETNKLVEWKNGQAVPYPNADAQRTLLQTPLGLAIDQQNRLWVIDHGNHGFGTARLIAFDLNNNEVATNYEFTSDVAQKASFLQDLNVDSKGETVYIADVSFFRKNPALVVYDAKARSARRVLESDASVYPQDWLIRNPIKEMTFFGGLIALKPGVDGIVIDKQDEWIYYAAMTHDGLFRVRASDLKNAQLTADELSKRVERFSNKPLNDGLSIDNNGTVFITDVEHSGVMQVGQDRVLRTTIRSDKIRWADALKFGPDGWLYIADSAIPQQMLQTKSHIAANALYYIFRFKPGTMGVPGQ